jgi:hypothetical protein
MKMYPLVTPDALAAASSDAAWLNSSQVNGTFWERLAYRAGTGSNCLIIEASAVFSGHEDGEDQLHLVSKENQPAGFSRLHLRRSHLHNDFD